MGLFLFSYGRLIVCLYLYQKASGLSVSLTQPLPSEPAPPLKQIEEDFECTATYNGTCCAEDEFQCDDGSCIPLVNLCDSKTYPTNQTYLYKTECDDGSDETGCSELKCSSRNPPCKQLCSDLPSNRSRCFCNDGYAPKKSPHENECQDIDECKLGIHMCSQICVNIEGSYNCSCEKGFRLDNINHPGSCKAEDKHILILFNAHHWIYAYDMEREETNKFVPAKKVNSMDYDPVTDMIYWWNEHLLTLSRSYLPGTDGEGVTVGHEQTMCVVNDTNSIIRKSIAVDWSLGNLYWILNYKLVYGWKSSIMVSKLEGTPTKLLFYKINVTITSMVLDPSHGKIYWTIAGKHASEIGFSRMQDVTQKTFVDLRGQHPTALTLDQGYGRLYWFDTKSSTIYTVHKEGAKPIKILKIDDQVPLSMDVFGNHLYWVTKTSDDLSTKGQLIRHNKFGKGQEEILFDNLVGQSSIKVYHKRKHKNNFKMQWENMRKKCHKNCNELCIRTPHGYTCMFADNPETTFSTNICLENNLNNSISHDLHPLKCNCREWHKICNYSSPYHECNCKLPCQDEQLKDSIKKTSHKRRLNITGVIIVSVIIFCVLVTCFVLSFYKQRQKIVQNVVSKSFQMQEVR